jgi:hypothetical protein
VRQPDDSAHRWSVTTLAPPAFAVPLVVASSRIVVADLLP